MVSYLLVENRLADRHLVQSQVKPQMMGVSNIASANGFRAEDAAPFIMVKLWPNTEEKHEALVTLYFLRNLLLGPIRVVVPGMLFKTSLVFVARTRGLKVAPLG